MHDERSLTMRPHHLLACLLAAAPIAATVATPATASPPRPDTSAETPGRTTVALTINLRSLHERELRSYAAAVSTPGSRHYRQYLTAAQLSQRFGAPPGAVTRVSAGDIIMR